MIKTDFPVCEFDEPVEPEMEIWQLLVLQFLGYLN